MCVLPSVRLWKPDNLKFYVYSIVFNIIQLHYWILTIWFWVVHSEAQKIAAVIQEASLEMSEGQRVVSNLGLEYGKRLQKTTERPTTAVHHGQVRSSKHRVWKTL